MHPNDRSPDRRLRVGYVSPDFCDHVIGRTCAARAWNTTAGTSRCSAIGAGRGPSHHSPIPNKTPLAGRDNRRRHRRATGGTVRADRIDILRRPLVTPGRQPVAGIRPQTAPVQSPCGYPAGTGLLRDRLSPDRSVSRSPRCPAGPKPIENAAGQEEPARATVGTSSSRSACRTRSGATSRPSGPSRTPVSDLPALRNGCITFGCFNNFGKVNERTCRSGPAYFGPSRGPGLLLMATPGAHRERTVVVRAPGHRRGAD